MSDDRSYVPPVDLVSPQDERQNINREIMVRYAPEGKTGIGGIYICGTQKRDIKEGDQ